MHRTPCDVFAKSEGVFHRLTNQIFLGFQPDAYLCTAYPVEDEEYYIYSEPTDHSSLKIYTTFQKPQFVSGIFLLASYWFQIPPQVSCQQEMMSCSLTDDSF
ncbi:hypothetical protein BgiBS90_037265 [Biomphalaria glabrata]|nr:hypothetical protein BgiBS90_037265 [Biomphalaria glabrata]